jgi:hypothetical protein
VDVLFRVFLTSALARGEWSASCSGRFTAGERTPPPSTHWIGGWVDLRRRVEEKILDPTGTRTATSLSSRQSLYRRLEYDGATG